MSTRTDEQLQTALDALDDLQKHPGWALVAEHAQERWGAKAFAVTIADCCRADTSDAVALKVREALGERAAADELIALPGKLSKQFAGEQRSRAAAKLTHGRRSLGPDVEETR